jgi:hypothetical protein
MWKTPIWISWSKADISKDQSRIIQLPRWTWNQSPCQKFCAWLFDFRPF